MTAPISPALLPTRDEDGARLAVVEASQRSRHKLKDKPEWMRNDRLLAVAVKSRRHGDCHELKDVAANVLDETEQLFVAYSASKRASFRPLARRGTGAAPRLIEQGQRRVTDGR